MPKAKEAGRCRGCGATAKGPLRGARCAACKLKAKYWSCLHYTQYSAFKGLLMGLAGVPFVPDVHTALADRIRALHPDPIRAADVDENTPPLQKAAMMARTVAGTVIGHSQSAADISIEAAVRAGGMRRRLEIGRQRHADAKAYEDLLHPPKKEVTKP